MNQLGSGTGWATAVDGTRKVCPQPLFRFRTTWLRAEAPPATRSNLTINPTINTTNKLSTEMGQVPYCDSGSLVSKQFIEAKYVPL